MKRRQIGALAVSLVAGVVAAGVPGAGAQLDCSQPTTNALIAAEAAVSRPALASPSEYPVSNVYSVVSQVTKPLFTYAEAGPQFAGAFEALAPAGSPKPPRAVSAYPSEDIPDESTSEWGGTSRTEVTPISAFASSGGDQTLGPGGATAKSSRSWATSRVDCDVVTVIAGWEANDIVFAPGVTAKQMGEVVTLVVGPDGSSADVEVTAVGFADNGIPIEGRPFEQATDPFYENGGMRIDAGEPRTEVSENHASASGGGFHFKTTDPETGQGAGYAIGGVNATIDVLGALVEVEPEQEAQPVAAPVTAPPPPPPAPEPPREVGQSRAVIGNAPAPSVEAVQSVETLVVTDELIDFVTVESRNWLPLYAFLAALLALGSLAGSIVVGQDRYPTFAWIVVNSTRRAGRFAAQYIKW